VSRRNICSFFAAIFGALVFVTHDAIRETTVASTRSYHLGHYDGGFGRIHERDTEASVEGPGDLLPVLLQRWFHAGAAFAEVLEIGMAA
jgi:hypothetical protein